MLGKSENILREGHQIKLLQSGYEYFAALYDGIASAKQSIHLQFYIYDDDETGYCVSDLLCKAAKSETSMGCGNYPLQQP